MINSILILSFCHMINHLRLTDEAVPEAERNGCSPQCRVRREVGRAPARAEAWPGRPGQWGSEAERCRLENQTKGKSWFKQSFFYRLIILFWCVFFFYKTFFLHLFESKWLYEYKMRWNNIYIFLLNIMHRNFSKQQQN